MDFISHLLAIVGLIALAVLYYLRRRARSHISEGKSPPEPPGAWPVLGHLHLLGGGGRKPLARTLGAMADKKGPIFMIRIGKLPALVVSSWEAVKECFTTNDRAFATRPHSSTLNYLSYNSAGFGFAPYGSYWRDMRKLAMIELLSGGRLEMLKHVRVSEVSSSIRELYSLVHESNINNISVVNITVWIEHLTSNIIVRMIAGKRYFDSAKEEEAAGFRKVIKEFMRLSGDFPLYDAIPFPPLRWIDLITKVKNVKRVMKELDSIVESWIEEHIQGRRKRTYSVGTISTGEKAGDEKDFIDVLLSVIDDTFSVNYGYTRETIIKATVLNLFLAGSETTSVNLMWALSLLLNNRPSLKLAQEEINAKVGKHRWAEESDIKDLVYLQAVVKETLRLYPPGPIGVPHEAMEDCQVGGYHIPKGTRLLANVWKLHRDPRIWPDPEKFVPERFLTSHREVDVSGQHFEFIPFGSGRRSCPGITFAMQVTHLTLARLLQGFDFTTPLNEPVDMTEGMGITLPKITPLLLVVTPRLPSEFYLS